MITSKEELKQYLLQDQHANFIAGSKVLRHFNHTQQTLKATYYMRKSEFYFGTNRPFLGKVYKRLMEYFSAKLGMILSVNVFGPGLRIAHPYGIVIAPTAKIGANCFIHQGVTVGVNENEKGSPVIGNNTVIGAGAKIIGKVEVADGVCIGANAVVVKSITESNTTWAGTPAKKISDGSARKYLSALLFQND